MAADESGGARTGPVVLRIKLRYDSLETMVERFAVNVGKSGMFLPTKAIQPIGTQVKFELRILDDTPVLVGMGRVTAVCEPDAQNPRAVFGISIELMRVSREGGEVIKKMIAQRKAQGLPPVGIPTAEDIEAARVDAAPKPIDSGAREPSVPVDSGPIVREPSVPVPRQPVAPVATLAPEPAKPKRPRISELIAQAQSGPIAAVTVPGLDEDVDVGKALARARVLAGGDLDAELEALRENAAAPTPIDIEAASAELAKQLGGAAVSRRERSGVARWAPPPAVEAVAPVAAIEPVSPPPAVEPVASSPEATPVVIDHRAPSEPPRDVIVDHAQPVAEPPSLVAELAAKAEPAPEPEASASGSIPLSESDILAPEPAATEVDDVATPPHLRPALMMIDDSVDAAQFEHQLASRDSVRELEAHDMEPLDEEEHTEIGALPVDPRNFQQGYASVPASPPGLESRLEAELELAEEEANNDYDELVHQQRTKFADENKLATQVALPHQFDLPDEELEIEEIDDIDVLAEADAGDADLMLADGEADAPPQQRYEPPPAHDDFASRLELDDDDPAAEFDERPAYGSNFLDFNSQREPLVQQPARASSHYDPPSGNYTLADEYREQPPAWHAQADEPKILRPRSEDDLEIALEQLDVNLDELSGKEAVPIARKKSPTGSNRHVVPRKPTPARPLPRMTTEDGVMIEFDDDDDDK